MTTPFTRFCAAFVRLICFSGIATLGVNSAWASFGNCNDPAYLAQFDPSLASAHGFLCVESDRLAVTSDAGTTHIRIVQHLVADWATRPGAMRAIKDGVAASVRAMGTRPQAATVISVSPA
jgi:hypothetical protein